MDPAQQLQTLISSLLESAVNQDSEERGDGAECDEPYGEGTSDGQIWLARHLLTLIGVPFTVKNSTSP